MRPDGIVVASPVLDQHLRLAERREDLAVQELISELRVQALAVAVLPRASRFDVERLDADPTEPASYVSGDELGSVVGPNVFWRAVSNEEIGETVEHVIGSEPPCDDDRQTAARELVEHDEHAECATVLCPILDKVVRPDVVWSLGSQPHARPVGEPETAPLRLLHWYLQPFPTPDPIDALDVDPPAFGNEHLTDAPVAVAAVLLGEPHDIGCQRRFVVRRLEMPPLRRAWLSDDSTCAAFRDIQARTDVLDARPLAGRA